MPDRIVGDKVVLVRPDADEAVVLAGAAAVVWVELDDWTTEVEIAGALAESHPETGDDDRLEALTEALRMLEDEGLLERRGD